MGLSVKIEIIAIFGESPTMYSSTPPMSRDAMRGFKAKVEEEQRIQQIKNINQGIYSSAIRQAQTTIDSVYKYTVPLTRQVVHPESIVLNTGSMTPKEAMCMKQQALYQKTRVVNAPSEFMTKNMPDILQGLREMFPGCLVKHARLVRGQDGNMYDMDTIDEKVLPFIDQSQSQEYITIDWS